MSHLLTLAGVVLALVYVSAAQLIIPKTPFGYIYNGGSNDAPIHLDIHMGPLCPDSGASLPVAKSVAEHYGASTLKLTLHMFPLPYHHQAYLTAIGAQVVKHERSVNVAYKWFDTIYANLDKLSNDATYNMSTHEVIRLLGSFAKECGLEEMTFFAQMASETMENDVRAAWKYSCSRSVASTPTFMLNDVVVEAEPTWTLADWQQVIDPLLKGLGRQHIPNNKSCPLTTKKCEYLPGKEKCCTRGENCIPNVGCRCFGNGCNEIAEPKKACSSDTKTCQYLPGKVECCTNGEACIPNVGCRCFEEERRSNKDVEMMEIKPLV